MVPMLRHRMQSMPYVAAVMAIQVTQAHAICHKDSMKQVFVKQSAKNAVMNYHLKDTVVKT